MEDLTDLTLENEELKKEIKQMRAEMDKMSESMRIMEKQNAEGTSTVKQMTQMFEAMQKSAEKRSMVDTTETAATPDYPPGFTQGLMPVTVHLKARTTSSGFSNHPPQGSATNVVGVTTTPSAQQVFNSVTPSSQEKGSAAAVLGVTPAQNVQWFPWQQATNFGMPNQSMVFGAATGERVENGLKSGKIASDTPTMNNSKKPASGPKKRRGRQMSCAKQVGLMGTSLDGMCGLHSDTNHTIEDCEEFKRMLQDMMDRKLVQIGCGGNIVDVSVIDYSASTSPKPLVVHYTRDAAVRTTNRPIPITIQVPTSFPYKDNKAVPWRYDVEVLVGDRQVGETNVDTPNVTNIAGVGGMTRSGRIYTPDEFRTTQSSEVKRRKRKERR
ncbi:hypothetical protein SESBI_14542 [Sesbania bispinosa]|nr:hypothetical protein SESBI_14542 [Sesbania bispinosa]